MARGAYKKATTVYASSCRVYKVTAKFNMDTSRCVFIYIYIYIYIYIIYNIHGYISVWRVCKHDPVAR